MSTNRSFGEFEPSIRESREPKELNLQYAEKLLFQSFWLSQGDASLQNHIFEYIHTIHSEWRLEENMVEDLQKKFTEIAKSYIPNRQHPNITPPADKKHKGVSTEELSETVSHETLAFKDALDGKSKPFDEEYSKEEKELLERVGSIGIITEEIVRRDLAYLGKGRPRKKSDNSELITPRTDPWLSYVCYYALEGNTTGVAEYDQLFREIGELLRRELLSSDNKKRDTDIKSDVFKIVKLYNGKHLNHPVDLEKFLSKKEVS